MKKFLFPLAFFMLFLSACSKSPQMDINVFFDQFNSASEFIDFSVSGSSFSTENGLNTHYCQIDKNILISLTSLENSTISRCSITFNHKGDKALFRDTVSSCVYSFCNGEFPDIFNEMKLSKNEAYTDKFSIEKDSEWYTFNCESTENVTVFIIRAKQYCTETNTSPTLKEKITHDAT